MLKEGTYVHATEGYSRTQINSLGMRNSEIHRKQQNEYRILALGDSFTEAFQVQDNMTYTKLLQNRIQSSDDQVIDVVNGGRSGAGPAHYIQWADFLNSEIEQDYTIIQLNDSDFINDAFNSTRQFYVIESERDFAIKVNENFSSANPLLQKFPQFKDLLELSVVRTGATKAQELFLSPKSNAQEVSDKDISTDYTKLVEWSLKEMKAKYNNIVIVYLPYLNYEEIDVNPSELEQTAERYAKEYNIGLINMRDSFITHYLKYKQPSHGFQNTTPGEGHMNKTGHELVAQRLSEYFREALN